MTVTLGTGDEVVLTADVMGAALLGKYTVGPGDNSADLRIDDVAATAGKSVTTPFGQNMTVFEVP